jgi:dsRNA-specific ribonuclease
MKVCADVIESLLGLIHIRLGYKTALSVGLEMGILLPDGKGAHDEEFISVKRQYQGLQCTETAKRLTGRAHFECPGLTEEALTHPSKVHEAVPIRSENLNGLGDAALCVGFS